MTKSALPERSAVTTYSDAHRTALRRGSMPITPLSAFSLL
jgi:hypothetical protein